MYNKLYYANAEEIQALDRTSFIKLLGRDKRVIYREVIYNKLKEYPKLFKGFFGEANYLQFLKDEDNTLEFQKAMLNQNYSHILKLPYVYPEIILDIFAKYYINSRDYVGLIERTTHPEGISNLILNILKKNPYFIQEASFKKLGLVQEHYMAVVQAASGLVHCVPKEYRTPELLEVSIISGKSLAMINDEEKTASMCKKAVLFSASALQYVPMELRTKELCEIALEKGFSALKFIPKKHQTSSVKMRALMKNPNAKKYIKK